MRGWTRAASIRSFNESEHPQEMTSSFPPPGVKQSGKATFARDRVPAAAALDGLIDALRRLPGVGQKSAQRMAFHLLQHDRDGALRLAAALQQAVTNVGHCARCHTFAEQPICATCWASERLGNRESGIGNRNIVPRFRFRRPAVDTL